jgi:hypothetical protein
MILSIRGSTRRISRPYRISIAARCTAARCGGRGSTQRPTGSRDYRIGALDDVQQRHGFAVAVGAGRLAGLEHIRRTSIRFHQEEDEAARYELEATLNGLSHGQSIQIIRAFSYFSQRANIAEDQHHSPDKSPRAGRFGTTRHHGPRAKCRLTKPRLSMSIGR